MPFRYDQSMVSPNFALEKRYLIEGVNICINKRMTNRKPAKMGFRTDSASTKNLSRMI